MEISREEILSINLEEALKKLDSDSNKKELARWNCFYGPTQNVFSKINYLIRDIFNSIERKEFKREEAGNQCIYEEKLTYENITFHRIYNDSAEMLEKELVSLVLDSKEYIVFNSLNKSFIPGKNWIEKVKELGLKKLEEYEEKQQKEEEEYQLKLKNDNKEFDQLLDLL